MNFLLVYKGRYGENLAGPEMRNIGIARALLERSHRVTLAGRPAKPHCLPHGCDYVCLGSARAVLRAFCRADVIVLHGGGPLLLAMAVLAGLTGKKLVGDAYVPHWIELEQSARPKQVFQRLKLHAKACFNVWRTLLMSLVFNVVIAANRRQLDLYRGMSAPFELVQGFDRIVVIPFGCDTQFKPALKDPRRALIELSGGVLDSSQFLVGWLGGVYEWFGLDDILVELAAACEHAPHIRFVFFGVKDNTQQRLLATLPKTVHGHFVFLPWVPFSERFNYWQGLDMSLVWGRESYENDYASRTRNTDCVTLALPIIQNRDDDWGQRLETCRAGVVVDKLSLGTELSRLALHDNELIQMQAAMKKLAPALSWECFADILILQVVARPMSFFRRIAGLLMFMLASPALLMGALVGVPDKWRQKP